MIIKFAKNTTKKDYDIITNKLKNMNFDIKDASCENQYIIRVVGNSSNLDVSMIESYDFIDKVIEISKPYKLANRSNADIKNTVRINNSVIGDNNFLIIAGPCAVESQEQILSIAKEIKKSNINVLRGGAYKPRTSPYAFDGLGKEGILYLNETKKVTGMPIVTEIMSVNEIELFNDYVDVFQVGARNMYNYSLLIELGKLNKPVLLKRGLSATIKEWLLAAEYILKGGNNKVILCERGIRTFETASRNTLDIGAIPIIKKETNLPIIIDPSHASGHWWMVPSLSKAAMAAGADGLIIEVHNKPHEAMSDGGQSLNIENFNKLINELNILASAFNININ